MFRSLIRIDALVQPHKNLWLALALLGSNLFFNVIANASFKFSALSPSLRGFLTWQVVGNLAGFITVLTLTGLLRQLPLHVAYTVTTGLSVIGVQVLAAKYLFDEPISASHWLGVLLVVTGILFVGGR
jgi:multidrug transporter EmrE-like cation transporter